MLVIDDRERDILPVVSKFDVDVVSMRLEFGDCMFFGSGPDGIASVGIERKKLTDLIACMKDRRLIRQLSGMAHAYDYLYIVVESNFRVTKEGIVEIPSNKGWLPMYFRGIGITYRQIDSYLNSLEVNANIIVCRTRDINETANLYVSRYHWWQKKWSAHHAHQGIYASGPSKRAESGGKRGTAWVPPRTSTCHLRVASQLPNIDRRAYKVEDYFPSIGSMINASEEEWLEALEIKGGSSKDVDEILETIWRVK